MIRHLILVELLLKEARNLFCALKTKEKKILSKLKKLECMICCCIYNFRQITLNVQLLYFNKSFQRRFANV